MKKTLLLLTVSLFFACSGVKKTQQALNSGSYDSAISTALGKLQDKKDRKNSSEYILLLEEAFLKATERDLSKIKALETDGNNAFLEDIYNLYVRLENRQEAIRPLLPLYIEDENRNANFKFKSYTNAIVDTKKDLAAYLYNNAAATLRATTIKSDFRNVYEDLLYLDKLSPNYKNTANLLAEAKFKGTDYVIVTMTNQTNLIIPQRLEDELLSFDSYGLNDDWTQYHNNRLSGQVYDYELAVSFTDIFVSPEKINEKEVRTEKQVVVGQKNLLNEQGQVVKDSLGNAIKIDDIKTVTATFYKFTQQKSAYVKLKVELFNLADHQLLQSYPFDGEFIFENDYGNYRGDERALDNDYLCVLENKMLPFPSNEDMVYHAGEALKEDLKYQIKRML